MNQPLIPAFPHFHIDVKDSHRHKKCDVILLLFTVVFALAYACYTATEYFNPLRFTAVCYATDYQHETPITVKDLCYTAENIAGNTAEVKAKALHTFTCRSTFSGERWGIILEDKKNPGAVSNTGGNTGGNAGGNAGGGPVNKKGDGQNCQQNNDCASGKCDGNPKKCQSARRSLANAKKVRSLVNPLKFCTNVVTIPDAQLLPFSQNEDSSVLKSDMTQVYNFEDDGFGRGEPDTAKYYQIKGENAYYENEPENTASTLTCCGNRLTTNAERLLDWLAAVGGFAGLVHAFFFWLSGQEFTGCGSATDQENEVGQSNFCSLFFVFF